MMFPIHSHTSFESIRTKKKSNQNFDEFFFSLDDSCRFHHYMSENSLNFKIHSLLKIDKTYHPYMW